MHINIDSVTDLGRALRATRKGSKVRLDDLADIAGVSKQFVSDVERGKPSVQLGRALRLLAEMGLRLSVDIPDSAAVDWKRLQAKAGATTPAQDSKTA